MSVMHAVDPMVVVRRSLERLFNEAAENFEAPHQHRIAPALDLLEAKDAFQVRVELPGVEQADLQLTFHEGTLTIKGEKKQDWNPEQHEVHRVERRYGNFERTLNLPPSVDIEKVAATFKNGVLVISLPKREEAKPREINIQIS